MQDDVKRLYLTLFVAMIALFLFNKILPKPSEEALEAERRSSQTRYRQN